MKRLISIILFFLLPTPACAAELQRLEFDLGWVRYDTGISGKRRNAFAFNSDIRVSLLETSIGKFGLEGRPGVDSRNVIANAGAFYEPASWIQLHIDHTSIVPFNLLPPNWSDVNMSLVNNIGSRVIGSEMVGVRFILK